MSPGEETRELMGNIEERLRLAREAQARENELKREAQRQKDMRLLLYFALAGAVAILGTAAAFWDDIVRNEIRLEQLEDAAVKEPSAD